MKRIANHRDTRGAGNQGALVAIVLLVLALFAVFFLWQREADDADLEVDIGGGAMALEAERGHPGAPPD